MKKTIMKLPKGANIQLTKNFNSSELDCKCHYGSCTHTLIDLEHIVALQKLRDIAGPIKINSGYRCKKHNKDVGGVPTSQHVKGTATDIVSARHTIDMLNSLVTGLFRGVGLYNTFIHIDSRENYASWDRRDKK